jgi:hypothetical protein
VITTRDGSGDMATEIGHGIGEFIDNGKKEVSRFFLLQNFIFRKTGFSQ